MLSLNNSLEGSKTQKTMDTLGYSTISGGLGSKDTKSTADLHDRVCDKKPNAIGTLLQEGHAYLENLNVPLSKKNGARHTRNSLSHVSFTY